MKFILASASPRRREILMTAGFDFEVVVSDADESLSDNLLPQELVCALAEKKALAVAACRPDELVVGADTVVVLDGKILGKPGDFETSVKMLKELSGRTHTVFTGVALEKGGKAKSFFESTQVSFYPLSEAEICSYAASGEPFDKAGAYGIQGLGCLLVKKIDGDYFNVVGFPVSRFAREIAKFV